MCDQSCGIPVMTFANGNLSLRRLQSSWLIEVFDNKPGMNATAIAIYLQGSRELSVFLTPRVIWLQISFEKTSAVASPGLSSHIGLI